MGRDAFFTGWDTLWLSGWERGARPIRSCGKTEASVSANPVEPLFGTGNLLRAISRDGGTFVLGNNARETFVVAKRSGGKPVHLKQPAVLSAAISPDWRFRRDFELCEERSEGVAASEGPDRSGTRGARDERRILFVQSGWAGTLTVCSSEGALRYRTRDGRSIPPSPVECCSRGPCPLPDHGMIACRDGPVRRVARCHET